MKTTRLLALAVLPGIIMATACSKNTAKPTQTTPTPTGKPYNMSATINGTKWSRDSCGFTPDLGDTTEVLIYGWAGYPKTRSDYFPQIYLDIRHYHGVGTYSSNDISGHVDLSDTSKEIIVEATITITASNTKVVGTFSCKTFNNIVTDGSFTALRD